MSPAEFCQEQISQIVEQLSKPITPNFRAEANALTADLVDWWAKYRVVEAMEQMEMQVIG